MNVDNLWIQESDVDYQEPGCTWDEDQIACVDLFKTLFDIDLPAHDYYWCGSEDCMMIRFNRTPRMPKESQMYVVQLSVTESGGIYILLDGKKLDAKKLTPVQRSAIIRLNNSITVAK